MRERIDLRKVAAYSIVINAVQIAAVLIITALLLTVGVESFSVLSLRIIVIVAAALVCWGAVVDIREARSSLRAQRQADALEQAYRQLEALNQTLRAQRHDFMNHLQVVYSLIEMQEGAEALDYIERVHGDMQRVSRMLRTASPAVNALLQAKLADAEKRGIQVNLTITSQWQDLPVPGWEMCRVLGNLIDNAMDALKDRPEAGLTITLYENMHAFCFQIANNGEPIAASVLARIFTPGFTTKAQGQGMGLYIVRSTLQAYGGDVQVASNALTTTFEGAVPRAAEGAQTAEDGKTMEKTEKL